ncbi:class I SAM-dependent methyltransferase [Kribbella sp. NBC_00662]|uniref:class I SAM-dependent methyltransferase n=1 Tax=Kribbella sp. NBC_00662 TaxID=2975969 RepID=UPI00324C4626
MKRPIFARMYARVRPAMDREGAAAHRQRLLAGASGRVVEIGAGDGGNFAHYPAEVVSVLAVEPEPYLRGQALRSAAAAPVPVEVVEGTAERLPAADGSADVVVASLVLCSVPDQQVALAEVARVLRPGGELRFYEHVAADGGRLETVQKLADATVWPWFAGGCHVHRDTAAAIEAAGFVIEKLDRFDLPADQPNPARPHILGRARSVVVGPVV